MCVVVVQGAAHAIAVNKKSRGRISTVYTREARALGNVRSDAVINSLAPGKLHMCSHPRLHELKGVLNYDLALNGERFAVFPKLQALAEDKGLSIWLPHELLRRIVAASSGRQAASVDFD
jgi:hypothetical protein